jgi:TRAP-type transport system periplasmic protein
MKTLKKKITWVIAHKPEHLFIRTTEAFKEEIEKILPGHFELEVLKINEYVEKYNKYPQLKNFNDLTYNSSPLYKDFFEAIENGDISMGQFQVGDLALHYNQKMQVLNVPFIFDNHEHVAKTVEGTIGEELRNGVTEAGGLKSLAFTYSGGYRVLGSHKPIDTLKDVQKVATSSYFLARVIESTLGAKTIEQLSYVNNVNGYPNDELPVVEATYLRFPAEVKHIYKTNHSVFLTNIVIGKKFWNSLTEVEQEAIQKAAFNAARTERKWSLEDADNFELNAEKYGRIIKEMTAEEHKEFKQKSKAYWAIVKDVFKDKILSRIRKLAH